MDIISKFNLPSYIKGKSFSEASACIAKKFKDRTSPEDVATLNDLQGRLQQAQEFVKQQQEARTMPQGDQSNSFKEGGFATTEVGAGFQEGATSAELASSIGAGLGGVSALADMAGTAFGSTGIDTSGATAPSDVPSKGSAAASGAMAGAQAGASFGPWGMAAGAVFGGASSILGAGNAKQDAAEAQFEYSSNQHNKDSNSYEVGGQLSNAVNSISSWQDQLLNDFESESEMNDMNAFTQRMSIQDDKKQAGRYGVFQNDIPYGMTGSTAEDLNQFSGRTTSNIKSEYPGSTPTKGKNGFNPAELLRYAPAAMNMVQLAGLKKPKEIGLDRINRKYDPNRVDERGLQNTVQEGTNNTKSAILGASGGSGSAARANLLASQLQGTKALSAAYQQATAENRADSKFGQQFDSKIDAMNLQQANREMDLNLEQTAAYQTNRNKLISQIGNDLGGIGTEELYKKYPAMMGLNYNWRGQHAGQALPDDGSATTKSKKKGKTKGKKTGGEIIADLFKKKNQDPGKDNGIDMNYQSQPQTDSTETPNKEVNATEINNVVEERENVKGIESVIKSAGVNQSISNPIVIDPITKMKTPLYDLRIVNNELKGLKANLPDQQIVRAAMNKITMPSTPNTRAKVEKEKAEAIEVVKEEIKDPTIAPEVIRDIIYNDEEAAGNPLSFASRYLGIDENDPNGQKVIKGFFDEAVPGWVKEKGEVTKDSKAWCAAFANHVLQETNLDTLEYGKDAFNLVRARQYQNIGSEVDGLENAKPGDVVVVQDKQTKGYHVAFYSGRKNGKYLMLGGNQDNKVSVKEINTDSLNVTAVRRVKNVQSIKDSGLADINSTEHYQEIEEKGQSSLR